MGASGDGGGSFEDRLQAARRRHGLDPAPEQSFGTSERASALATGLRVGLELVCALLVGVGIGWLLDRWLHTSPVLLVVFSLFGWAAGVLNVWRLMGPRRQPPAGQQK
jgi:ATP synthase protein I